MSILRAALRILAIGLVNSTFLVILFALRVCLGNRSPRGLRWRRWCLRHWSRAVAACLGARIEVSGPLPPAPCVLVSNHLGYVDIVVLGACVDTVFVSKSEVRSWPLIGWCATAAGTIFLDRKTRRDIPSVNAQIHSSLVDGDRVLFFPEGTSTGGTAILPFKSSLLEPAASSGYPVFCAAVHYSTRAQDPPAALSVCWWGNMEFTAHLLRLLSLSHFRAQVVFHPEPQLDGGRKELAQRTEQVVHGLLQRLSAS